MKTRVLRRGSVKGAYSPSSNHPFYGWHRFASVCKGTDGLPFTTILPDKYEIVDEPPKAGKDFNDFLCMRMGIYNKKKHERNEER